MIDFIEYLFLIFQVFTWHRATIELEGKKELAYMADEVFIYLKKIYYHENMFFSIFVKFIQNGKCRKSY